MTAYFFSIHQGESRWWSWLVGMAFIGSFTTGCILLARNIYSLFPVTLGNLITKSFSSETFTYILLLINFLPIFVAIIIAQKIWHLRPIKKLLTSASRFRWNYLFRTMFIIFVFYGLLSFGEFLIFPNEYEALQFQTNFSVYFKLLIITLIFVPFQAASEELLCRGYLNQALVKYIGSPWVVFIITSAGFAALHAGNPEASGQLGPYLSSIFLFGMAMCVLLYFEGGIESAIGAHIANNIFVFALLGYEDPYLPNTSLFTLGEPVIGWKDFGIEVVMTIILIALIIWANRKWGAKA